MTPGGQHLRTAWVSDRHLRLSLGDDMSLVTHRLVRTAFERLREAAIPGLRDLTPAYATLLVTFDPATLDARRAESDVAGALRGFDESADSMPARLVEIPVCYEGECGPDLDDVARLLNLARGEVVSLHSGTEYFVHFIGFSPGFPYLGGLPSVLTTPRLERPRVRVPAGSVGIAGGQTGIYPQSTPGGWRLIGRTPARLFDANRDPPSLLTMGNRVRFVPIGLDAFDAMNAANARTGG